LALGTTGCTCKCTCQPKLDDRPAWLYRAYTDGGDLLYIGITVDPKLRMRQHYKSTVGRRWVSITRTVVFELYEDRRTAHILEQRAITQESPSHNGISDPRLLEFVGPLAGALKTTTNHYGKLSW